MTQQSYLLLLALADGRQHGYGLAGRVRELSGGEVALGAGTLYGNLERLLGARFIGEDGEEIADGRARRYYRLTDEGLRAARAETLRLAQLAATGRSALGAIAPDGVLGGLA